jgi:ABC-type multidrug transport system permease subunit
MGANMADERELRLLGVVFVCCVVSFGLVVAATAANLSLWLVIAIALVSSAASAGIPLIVFVRLSTRRARRQLDHP